MMMCYNLRRLMSILGVSGLKQWLKSIYVLLQMKLNQYRDLLSLLFYWINNFKNRNTNFFSSLYESLSENRGIFTLTRGVCAKAHVSNNKNTTHISSNDKETYIIIRSKKCKQNIEIIDRL